MSDTQSSRKPSIVVGALAIVASVTVVVAIALAGTRSGSAGSGSTESDDVQVAGVSTGQDDPGLDTATSIVANSTSSGVDTTVSVAAENPTTLPVTTHPAATQSESSSTQPATTNQSTAVSSATTKRSTGTGQSDTTEPTGSSMIEAPTVTGQAQSASTQVVSTETSSTETGSPETGSTETGSTETGSTETGTVSGEPARAFVVVGPRILGSWSDGNWLPNSAVAPPLTGVELSYVAGDSINVVTQEAAPKPWCDFGSAPSWRVESGVPNAVGISGLGWDPRPRSISNIEATAEHLDAVEEVLLDAGLVDPTIVGAKVMAVDLEGDGTQEILIEARYGTINSYGSVPGDYSLLLLRRVSSGGSLQNVVLGVHATTGAEPYAAAVDDSSAPAGTVTVYSIFYSLVDGIDLNGDGRLELVTSISAEGYSENQILAMSSGRPLPVLSSRCGS